MRTLADQLPVQQERCRKLLRVYHELGPVGIFGAAVIEAALTAADQAAASGDVAAMIVAYCRLKECE